MIIVGVKYGNKSTEVFANEIFVQNDLDLTLCNSLKPEAKYEVNVSNI